jgi:hypothetical protein
VSLHLDGFFLPVAIRHNPLLLCSVPSELLKYRTFFDVEMVNLTGDGIIRGPLFIFLSLRKNEVKLDVLCGSHPKI